VTKRLIDFDETMITQHFEAPLLNQYSRLAKEFQIPDNISVTSYTGLQGQRKTVTNTSIWDWLSMKAKQDFTDLHPFTQESLVAIQKKTTKEGLFFRDLKKGGIRDSTIRNNVLKVIRFSAANVYLAVFDNHINMERKKIEGFFIAFIDISGTYFRDNRDHIVAFWICVLEAKQVSFCSLFLSSTN
jgi:hypothetical protein